MPQVAIWSAADELPRGGFRPPDRALRPGLGPLDDRKRTLDYSLLAYTLINDINQESRSALPDAPVVPARRTGRARTRLAALNGWLASGLHQAAWAIEPQPPTLTGNRHRGPRPDEGAGYATPPARRKSLPCTQAAGLSRCAGT